jgi:hypothetical protein
MSWSFVPAREGFPDLRTDWDRLNRCHHRSNPLLDSRFVAALLTHFGTGTELLASYRSGSEITALLIIAPSGFLRWSLFLPSQAQIGPLVCGDPPPLFALVRALPGGAVWLDLLAQDEAFSCLPAYVLTDRRVTSLDHALTISVDLASTFGSYWDQRNRSVRKNIRRYVSRTSAMEPALSLSVYDAPEEMPNAVARYGELESSGWKGGQGSAIHPSNTQGRFYSQIMQDFAQSGNAQVYEYRQGKRLLASRLCILSDESLVILKTTYDEAFSALAPGRLLLYLILEREFALKRCRWIEFYTNATADQIAWSTHQRHIRHVTVFRNRWLLDAYRVAKSLRSVLRRDASHADRSGHQGNRIKIR